MFFVLFFSCLLLLFSFYKQIYFEHKISIEKNKEKKKKYCVLLDFLRLPGAMIVTDHLLQEPIQRRIDANTIRIKSYFKWHHKIKWNPFNPRSFHHWVFFEHGFIGFNGYLLRSRYCQQIFYTSPRQWGLSDYSRICRKTFGDLVRILGKNIQIKDEPNLSVGTNAYTF